MKNSPVYGESKRVVLDIPIEDLAVIDSKLGLERDPNEKLSWNMKAAIYELVGLPTPMTRAEYQKEFYQVRDNRKTVTKS